MKQYDFIIVGGGILGLATARQLQQQFPGATVAVLEKEARLATHQTRHNSGVIHAGVYYAPGSLKARFCREGNRATKAFCRDQGILFRETGKLLVATDDREVERMQALVERCRSNDIETEVLDRQQLREREPHVVGVAAVWVPATGIVDFREVAVRMAELFTAAGGIVRTGRRVVGLREADLIEVATERETFVARFLIGCAGLHADRLAAMFGRPVDFKILPFRGEYFRLPDTKSDLVRHPIYPIPDPDLPFLGIHLTPMVDGTLTVGPNAALALAREGYSRWTVDRRDLFEMLGYPGLYRLIGKYPLATLAELKNSLYRPGYLQKVRRYCPQINLRDLRPYPAGVRAQAVRRDGTTLEDFLFVEGERSLIVGNAPSPAATSAMPIARHICERVAQLI
ncbi:MAG TPA: L-2-hydroxyglutarate oxidase [Desulfuromonadales bacterium]|nr:L-2-hydroxyglutarate oxidase [Desulfuromonadales bacterium]